MYCDTVKKNLNFCHSLWLMWLFLWLGVWSGFCFTRVSHHSHCHHPRLWPQFTAHLPHSAGTGCVDLCLHHVPGNVYAHPASSFQLQHRQQHQHGGRQTLHEVPPTVGTIASSRIWEFRQRSTLGKRTGAGRGRRQTQAADWECRGNGRVLFPRA